MPLSFFFFDSLLAVDIFFMLKNVSQILCHIHSTRKSCVHKEYVESGHVEKIATIEIQAGRGNSANILKVTFYIYYSQFRALIRRAGRVFCDFFSCASEQTMIARLTNEG